ncbi:hypothetical protein P168DRAFT_322534 [Aspergillus campestris IBT 28561]|uniref:Uncharacterized protein n=1 Tax=Aspergillus campestris (strain IBT 28561) TaxID=1392248 RepID=A0A2I1CR24_ASPC2|nr:uncharacterized protein P168DRAFT_322534 [Aspergillus campestris IBT 28561]PKY00076.1 hypothetical protein P168DRAFT_322534 [Aspergillus campestris IBT 28561]
MSSATLHEKRNHIYDDLAKLHEKLENVKGPSCSRSLLKVIGIHDVPVDILPTSIPEFNPVFFIPPNRNFYLETPYPRSTHVSHSAEEDNSSSSDLRYPYLLRRADTQLASTVVSRWSSVTGFTSFRNDGAIAKGKWPFRDELTLYQIDSASHQWTVSEVLECPHHTHPHVVFDLASSGDAQSDEQSNLVLQLKVGEIKSIVRVMRIAMEREYNRECLVVPVLLLSYTPPNHGRIIQAHHSGSNLVIQYTPRVAFDDPAFSLAELFLRYYCSNPVLPMDELDPWGEN